MRHAHQPGLSRAWDSITEGWRELREVAAEALTRFNPAPADDTNARYEAGVLTVRLPKAEDRQRSRIRIETD